MKILDTDLTELTEYSFDDWQKEWKTEHPILNKIDHLFKNESLVGYRASYAIARPWIFIREGWRQVRWAWQRIFNKYDERVIWSIDQHLAIMIPLWMRELKKKKHGVPMMMFKDGDVDPQTGNIPDDILDDARNQYEEILEKIAIGFEKYAENDWPAEESAEFVDAFELLKKYFGTLWD